MEKENLVQYTEAQIGELIKAVERLLGHMVTEADRTIEPYRRSAFSRFPFMFTLLGALGTSAFFFGFNKMLERAPVVGDHPLLVLILGFLVLALTGTLYKRLS